MKASQFKTLTAKAEISNTKTLTRAKFTSKAAANKLSKALTREDIKHTMKDEYTVSVRTALIDSFADLAAAIIGDKKPVKKAVSPVTQIRNLVKATPVHADNPESIAVTITRIKNTSDFKLKFTSNGTQHKAIAKHLKGSEIEVEGKSLKIQDVEVGKCEFAECIVIVKTGSGKKVKKSAEKGRFEIKGTHKGKRFTEYADTLAAAKKKVKLKIRDTAKIVDNGMCKRMVAAEFGCVNPNNGRAIKGYTWFVLDSYKKALGEFDKVGSNGKGEKRKFQVLKVENSWKVRTFFIGKTQIDPKGKTKEVDVEYKGGVSRLQCRWTENHDSVSDHGHEYGVKFMMLEFKFNLLGNTVWVPVEELKGIKLDVTQFNEYKEESEKELTKKKSRGRRPGGMSKPKRKRG